MNRDARYGGTAAAFDIIAADYDAAYGATGNAVMTWMRQENLALLQASFPRGSCLLELGCGTGEEAVALARAGYRVLATDISPQMASLTRRKAMEQGVGHLVKAVALPAGLAGALRPGVPFDGAYASFGGLNCEPNLPAVGAALARLIRPGGALVLSVMGRACLFEIVWYLLHAQPRRAFRRLRSGWQSAPVAGRDGREVTVPTRYLTVKEVRQAFPAFALDRALALPLLLPPPYADALYLRHPALFRALTPYERRLRDKRPWLHLGDHIALVLRRQADNSSGPRA
jgi:SAM-dependent methyltransferase